MLTHGYGLLGSIALLFTTSFALAANSSDPCATIAGKATANFHDAKACLDYFKFDKDIAKRTVDTVRKVTKELYVFNEVAASPPNVEGLSTPSVNISYGLDLILKEDWKSDREFQEAVALLLDKVQDAHLSYVPFCYRQFVFWQPIQLNSVLRNKRLVANVAFVKNDVWPEAKESWVGCEVTEIDGMEAMEMIVNYAVNNNGESKDVNTCYNNIMNTKSYFHGWDDGADDLGYHRFLPAQEFHNYTMRCPKEGTKPVQEDYEEPFTVQVPWIAQVPPRFSNADSYWSTFCQSSHLQKRDAHYDLHELKTIYEGDVFALNSEGNMNAVGSSKGPYIEFIELEDEYSKVGVIDIQSFSIASEDKDSFINDVITGFKRFEKKGIEKIILDLSSNGGGDACAGEFLISTLFNSTPDYMSDVKYSPFLERVVKKAYEQESTKWTDYANKEFSGSSWFTKTKEYKRGQDTVKFSQPVTLSCNDWNSDISQTYKNTKWAASDVLILSDGRCGSTCAIVASRLHLSHKVPAMGLGGIRGNRMQFASFPGGESDRLSSFLMDLEILGLTEDSDAPSPFPERADMGWTFREVYKPTSTFTGEETDLLEYNAINADCRMHFDDENAEDIKKLWSDVAKVILDGQCPYTKK
ncbi:hypothetical protein G6F46_010241 [Rhizopus delemar]|uniref:Tail specific protease domain-containing protein n=3 Tax=Rhizopus TaxID=4842 RepID=I1CK94_RHIO9|nr:hypothetical protein RO3G_13585 [Rhizopus delemar RA 99-880]KAG1451096.1 hypothetical protein G6F55_009353 [Rhizopus delemar]KAG1537529.1 hypothetical protein G6F51_010317 [Rhizopus arrhizus]KAG1496495.1 hypothetical protein G6F54_006430 [Rhizopus delemar]KAG1505987.1 hypothetical protein G6F53_010017 [Rhizopus delemar]|eukprot:EIE88874.1 hypothetical protein RO3G_13585 [Rhizopus delemar RA 99-880]